MLDKMSEKFLKYLIENQDNNNAIDNLQKCSKETHIPYTFIDDICRDMNEKGYIYSIHGDDGVLMAYLRHKGAVYFSEKRKMKMLYWKDFLSSRIVDIIFSSITTYLTAINLDSIIAFLKNCIRLLINSL